MAQRKMKEAKVLVLCDFAALNSSVAQSLSGLLSHVKSGVVKLGVLWHNRGDLFNVSAATDAHLDKAATGC